MQPTIRVVRMMAMMAALCAFWAGLTSCWRGEEPAGGGEVIVYCSVDDEMARPVFEAFERSTGIRVRSAGDTEATKTTGLVQRLRSQAALERRRCDVFWSNEPFMFTWLALESSIGDSRRLFSSTEIGVAQRARAIVYSTRRVSEGVTPRTVHDLADPRWSGRVVVARPEFGTTRGHVAAMVRLWGVDATRDLLRALRSNGVRLVDGNSAVVRAVAMGEADVGLTDTDDVWSGKRLGWEIDGVIAGHTLPGAGREAIGGLAIPCGVGVIADGPNPENAERFARFLLSDEGTRVMLEGPGGHFRVGGDELGAVASYTPAEVAAQFETADRLWREEWSR